MTRASWCAPSTSCTAVAAAASCERVPRGGRRTDRSPRPRSAGSWRRFGPGGTSDQGCREDVLQPAARAIGRPAQQVGHDVRRRPLRLCGQQWITRRLNQALQQVQVARAFERSHQLLARLARVAMAVRSCIRSPCRSASSEASEASCTSRSRTAPNRSPSQRSSPTSALPTGRRSAVRRCRCRRAAARGDSHLVHALDLAKRVGASCSSGAACHWPWRSDGLAGGRPRIGTGTTTSGAAAARWPSARTDLGTGSNRWRPLAAGHHDRLQLVQTSATASSSSSRNRPMTRSPSRTETSSWTSSARSLPSSAASSHRRRRVLRAAAGAR